MLFDALQVKIDKTFEILRMTHRPRVGRHQ